MIGGNIVAGTLDRFEGRDAVVLGERLASRLRVGVGDKVTMISPTSAVTVMGSVPRMKAYDVVALFNVGMSEYDNTFVYMPLEAAQVFFRSGETVNALEIFTTDPNDIRRFRIPLLETLPTDLYFFDWQQQNSSFFNALQVERNVMFLILTLIILVAAFNIISSLIMLVKDKGRDIAVLRTMGATRGMITRVFFMTGASVGLVGTALGSAIGLLFCQNIEAIRQALQTLTGVTLFDPMIYFLSRMPAEVDPWEVGTVIAMALGLSFAATIYPAWRAARIDPVEALRYE